MKGTPVFPAVWLSSTVVQVLTHLGVKFKGIDVLTDQPSRRHQAVQQLANHPRLYVKGEFLGGCGIRPGRCTSSASFRNCSAPMASTFR